MRNDVPTMEAGPAGADAAAGRVRWAPGKSLWLLGMSADGVCTLLGLERHQWDPGWWVLRGLARAGLARRIALPADLPHRPALVAWPTQTSQGRTT